MAPQTFRPAKIVLIIGSVISNWEKEYSIMEIDIQYSSILKKTNNNIKSLSERLLEVNALYNFGKSLKISFDIENILNEAGQIMKDSLNINDFSIFLPNETGETLTIWKANHDADKTMKDVSFKMGEGITGLVAHSGGAILIQDVKKDKRFLHYKGLKDGIGSCYSVPLKDKNNTVIGVFNVYKNKTNDFSEKDIALFNEVTLNIAQVLEHSIAFQEIRKLAITDELTGLYSRRYFLDALEKEISKAKRNQGFFSLIMIDVDHFKSVNDMYGHPEGDNILKKLANLLKCSTRQGDITARYGGEEFIVLLPGEKESDALSIAEKIRAGAEKCLTIEKSNKQTPEKVTISAGVASYPTAGQTSSELLTSVDSCLYCAKHEGKNKVYSAITNESLNNVDDKRGNRRYHVCLKASSRGINLIRFVEIKCNGQWKMCSLDNISKRGFKGYIEFESPHKGEKILFRLFSDYDIIPHDVFNGLVMYTNNITNARYSIGIEVVEEQKKWEDFYYKIVR